MAVNSVSGGSSVSSLYGNRNVLSGLASGMDTEAMIENMVMGTKNKITAQQQKQQKLLWRQEAYRSISDKLVQLSTKYTSYTSSTNLMSANFFKPSIVTTAGKYKDLISASGSTTSDIKITGVSQLAQTETISFTGLNGLNNAQSISGSKDVNLTGTVDVSQLAGKQLSFKYGNKSFSITFDSDREYNSAQDVADEINKQLGNASISLSDGTSIKMDSKVKASVVDGKISFQFTDSGETNTLELLGSSSQEVLDALHLSGGSKLTATDKIESSKVVEKTDLTTRKSAGEVLAGTFMKFTYNGTTATIKIPEKDSKEYNAIFSPTNGKTVDANLVDYLQTQLNQAFGHNRVKVDDLNSADNKLRLQFSVTSTSNTDTLSIDSGSLHVVGKSGIFGIERGASNRVNTSKTLGELCGDTLANMKPVKDENGKIKQDAQGNNLYAFEINGVKIGEYTADTTIDTIMQDINKNSAAGVKVTYSKTANQFVFSATHGGTGGRVAISKKMADGTTDNLAARLFGAVEYGTDTNKQTTATLYKFDKNSGTFVESTEIKRTAGRDATMKAVINGVEQTLTSGTNTFNIDGFTVTASGTFDSVAENDAGVSFSSKVDSDKIVDAIKSFVEDYNKVLDEINEQYSTQPDYRKKYEPLTDEQKADMTEKQIEEYEKKAKQGLLFNDGDLGSLSNGLRFLFSNSDLAKLGINVSTNYAEKGKISLDETKLRAALDTDPDAVASAFADPLGQKQITNADGSTSWVEDTSSGGVIARLKVQLDKYAGTTGATKGILIEKAGSQYSPLSLLHNSIQNQLEDITDVIDKLTDKLTDQIDTYTAKFSRLEVLISQMNAQSSYLAGLGGSGY